MKDHATLESTEMEQQAMSKKERDMSGVPTDRYDRARMALYKLSTIPGATEAIDRIFEYCQKEIAASAGETDLTALSAGRGSTVLTAAEKEVAQRCGVGEDDLLLTKAREEGARRVLATANEVQRAMLRVMVGDNEIEQARRWEQLRSAMPPAGQVRRTGDSQPLPGAGR